MSVQSLQAAFQQRSDAVQPRRVTRVQRGVACEVPDLVAVEAPLEIRTVVDGVDSPLSVTLRTPGEDEALAVGLLWAEGILGEPGDLVSVRRCSSTAHVVRVALAAGRGGQVARASRRFASTGSCGLCGKSSLEAMTGRPLAPLPVDADVVAPATLHGLPAALRRAQAAFESTGGLHAVAAFAFDGSLVDLHEDIGRHNAFDKLVGTALLAGASYLPRSIAVLSGRAGFEMVQKAAAAGIPVVAAIGAPSSLAIELAERTGITLAGFLSAERCNVYSHPARIVGLAAGEAWEAVDGRA
ncbi:MAG: formate dehydrogenase accessory sulfurtransferase FdhD [Pseudomonadota bacterium]